MLRATTLLGLPDSQPLLVTGLAAKVSEANPKDAKRPNEGVRLGGGPGGRPLKRPEAPVLFEQLYYVRSVRH